MTDWIEQLKQQQQAKDRDELEREQLLQRKLERFQLKLWQFIQDTKACLAEGVKALRASSPNDGRFHLQYLSKGEGFSLGGTLPSTVQLTVALDATKTELRTQTSLLGGSFAANVYTDTDADVNQNLFVVFEGERYYSPKEFARALMSYVMGMKNPMAD